MSPYVLAVVCVGRGEGGREPCERLLCIGESLPHLTATSRMKPLNHSCGGCHDLNVRRHVAGSVQFRLSPGNVLPRRGAFEDYQILYRKTDRLCAAKHAASGMSSLRAPKQISVIHFERKLLFTEISELTKHNVGTLERYGGKQEREGPVQFKKRQQKNSQ